MLKGTSLAMPRKDRKRTGPSKRAYLTCPLCGHNCHAAALTAVVHGKKQAREKRVATYHGRGLITWERAPMEPEMLLLLATRLRAVAAQLETEAGQDDSLIRQAKMILEVLRPRTSITELRAPQSYDIIRARKVR